MAAYRLARTDAKRQAVLDRYESEILVNNASLADAGCPTPPSPPRLGSATVAAQEAPTYTVQPGDSLYAIAARELGDGSRYPELVRLNGIANPRLIRPGLVLRLS